MLEKKIKQQIHSKQYPVEVLHGRGLSDICQTELQSILTSLSRPTKELELTPTENGLEINKLDLRQMLELAYRLKSARDLLWCLSSSKVSNVAEYKKALQRVPWALIIPQGSTVSIRVNSVKSRLYHEKMLEEHFEQVIQGLGYQSQKKGSLYTVDIRLKDNQMRVGISLYGDPFYKRGYKAILKAIAPIKEDLAYATILWAKNWLRSIEPNYRPQVFEAPFAGSGTLGFEAVLAFFDVPTFLLGRELAVEHFVCTPKQTSQHLRKVLGQTERPSARLILTDRDQEQVDAVTQNTRLFTEQMKDFLSLETEVMHGDYFRALPHDSKEPVFIAINPPYGERLGEKKGSMKLYKDLGESIAKRKPIAGLVFAPDVGCAQGFEKSLVQAGFKVTRRSVLSGGKTVIVSAFFKK